LKADRATRITTQRLILRGAAKLGARELSATAVVPGGRGTEDIASLLLAVALPAPFKIKGDYDMRWAARGTTHTRTYQIERGGFDGPIEVSLADRQARHLQGVVGPTI